MEEQITLETNISARFDLLGKNCVGSIQMKSLRERLSLIDRTTTWRFLNSFKHKRMRTFAHFIIFK